ncbi:DivIVA domain-containing protein [Hutsoniella sourekii]
MALTPNEILNKEFKSKFRGYDTDEVNDYLDVIVADYEGLINENHRLTQALSAATEKNEYFAQLQDSLNSSIVVAQEAADRLKQNARKEAELILYEAEREADQILAEASNQAQAIVGETDALRRQSKQYRQDIESLVRRQLQMITSEEFTTVFDQEFETNLRPEDFQVASSRASQRANRSEEETAADFQSAKDLVTESVSQAPDHLEQATAQDTNQDLYTEAYNYYNEINEEGSTDNLEVSSPADLQPEPASQDYESTLEEVNPASVDEPKKDTESYFGQTIRIELPTDED